MRWGYDFGDLVAAGIDIDPEQERIVSEGGLLLTLWPIRHWAERRYYHAHSEHWVDRDDQPVFVPVVFEAEPWTRERLEELKGWYQTHAYEAVSTWPTYTGTYRDPDFITPYIDLPQDHDVLRVWNGVPITEPEAQAIQIATMKMYAETGTDGLLEYYSALGDGEWWPVTPDVAEPEKAKEQFDPWEHDYQMLYEDLVKKGLITIEGYFYEYLPTVPLEPYAERADDLKVWNDLVVSSRFDYGKVMKVMAQDNHPNYELEEIFAPWS